jgi:hypothetical protein
MSKVKGQGQSAPSGFVFKPMVSIAVGEILWNF